MKRLCQPGIYLVVWDDLGQCKVGQSRNLYYRLKNYYPFSCAWVWFIPKAQLLVAEQVALCRAKSIQSRITSEFPEQSEYFSLSGPMTLEFIEGLSLEFGKAELVKLSLKERKSDIDYSVETILEALHRIDLGVPMKRIARDLGVPYHQVRAWLRRYSTHRTIEAISLATIKHRPGRPSNV